MQRPCMAVPPYLHRVFKIYFIRTNNHLICAESYIGTLFYLTTSVGHFPSTRLTCLPSKHIKQRVCCDGCLRVEGKYF